MEKKQTSQRTKNFFKKNVYYIIMAVCLLAIAAMVTVTVLINNGVIGTEKEGLNNSLNNGTDDVPTGANSELPTNNGNEQTNINDDKNQSGEGENKNPDDTKNQNEKPIAIVFANPVENVDIIQDYSMESLVWNSTLKHYAVHNGMDFAGAEGTNVMCVYDGVVTDISYDALNGNMVTIKHDDKLYSTYSSLNEPVVKVGQTVNKGAIIGTMGTTATAEYSLGSHVHFSVIENGNVIDPKTYLTVSNDK